MTSTWGRLPKRLWTCECEKRDQMTRRDFGKMTAAIGGIAITSSAEPSGGSPALPGVWQRREIRRGLGRIGSCVPALDRAAHAACPLFLFRFRALLPARCSAVPTLVMDSPHDPQTWPTDDQYLAGEDLLVAPVVAGESERDVYFPEGEWFDFWTTRKIRGRQRMKIAAAIDRIPLFVKSGTLLPMAEPVLHAADPNSFNLTVRVYGSGDRPCTLYEDDGSIHPNFTTVTLAWNTERQSGAISRSGPGHGATYSVKRWEVVG